MIGQGPVERFKPGSLLAKRYEVVRFLGAGGMGEVVLVNDKNLQNAQVVLKFLHSSSMMDEQQFLRFQNEALLMRELNHPHIVHVYDFGLLENKIHYLSMEYISGQSLGDLIRETPGGVDFKTAIAILYQISLALSFAHSKGIVHRDLKPDNVLLDELGDVRLTDFGLGKSMGANFSLTDTGQAVGTPHYMAPEQLRGEPAAPSSDMYSFGLLAYELVTGTKAYDAESYLSLAEKHLRDPIPVFANKQSGIPAWFQDFIEKCSAKIANKRFADFAEVAEILASHIPSTKREILLEPKTFGSSPSLQHWRVKWRWGQPKQIALIAFLTIFIGTLVGIIAGGRNNQGVRALYGKYYYMFENATGIESEILRNIFLGDTFLDLNYSKDDLTYRVVSGNSDQIEILLGAGMDPNLKNSDSLSLAQLAVLNGQARSVVLLHEFGADFTIEDENRRNLLILAVHSQRPEMVATVLPLIPVVSFDINDTDKLNKTALHYAIELKNEPMVDLLLKEGAGAHVLDGDNASALIYASASGQERILERILKNGGFGKIDLKDSAGYTALHYAARGGFLESAKLLLMYGADKNIKTKDEKSALDLAKEFSHSELVKLLDGF